MQRLDRAGRGRRLTRALALSSFTCAAAGAAAAATLSVQVQTAGGAALADAVVFLESAEARAAVRPAKEAEIAQAERRFIPQVSVVPVGTPVRFPNRDTVRHHVYSFSPAKNFELKLYAGTPANPVTFDRAGVVAIGCNIHDAMSGWVVVVDTPYYARSVAGGTATLADVPAGSYRLRTWHPTLPPGSAALDQPVTVGTGPGAFVVTLPGVPR
jgi:plastocyanin